MGAIELALDRTLFSIDVLARTAHRYTVDYFVEMRADGDSIHVRLMPRRTDLDSTDVAQRFGNDAFDDRLRAAVAAQTSELHLALVEAALAQAQPRRPGVA